MDIVERLRNLVILDEVGSNNSLANEAADMIEALRKDLDFFPRPSAPTTRCTAPDYRS